MIDFLLQYIRSNFVLIVLEIILLLLLKTKGKIASVDFRPMYITALSIILCTVLDRMETIITDDPTYYVQRLILSVVCYWLRPAYCLGPIFVLVKDRKKRILFLIPEIVNILVMSLAFLPVIGKYVFYFNSDFYFRRGPLGYTVFAVGLVYVLILLYLTVFHLKTGKTKENVLILICSVSVAVSTIAETGSFLRNVTSTMVMIGCLVYYLVIYIRMTSVDELTGLYNRGTYYEDSEAKHIVAVASIDMNGLKEMNDTKGHAAGDLALKTIAGVILEHTNPSTQGYRVGGDEFLLLFRKTDEAKVSEICGEISRQVEEKGYSVSIGYAFSDHETLKELERAADRRMYEMKSVHYGGKKYIR